MAFLSFSIELTAPLAYGGADVDLVTGADTLRTPLSLRHTPWPTRITPTRSVVTYNDSRPPPPTTPAHRVSSDGGTTFTRLNPSPFASGHGTNFGDPVTLYNKPTSSFFAIFLATGCGGQGIGAWKSLDGGVTWAYWRLRSQRSFDDRESGWADNNPSSPFFGRMYVSWNNFSVGSGALEVTFSTDNGATWHAPVAVSNTSTFIRDVQITGDLSGNGTIYIAGMDEGGGGFPHNNINHIYKSTDGGNTWTNTYTGPSFAGPGVASHPVTSPACLPTRAVSTGGTRAGVSLLHLTTWFTWSMPSTALAVTLAMSITSAPPIAA